MIINGSLYLDESSIESLGDIKEVKERLYLFNCKNLKSLNNIKKVGSLDLGGCENIITLGNLEIVEEEINLYGCKQLRDLGKIKQCQEIFLDNFLITELYVKFNYPHLYENCEWRIKI